MPRQGTPRRATAGDTTRLKRDIARNDGKVREYSKMLAEPGVSGNAKSLLITEARKLHKEANAKGDTLAALRRAAPTGTHHSFAEGTEGFDGRAITTESSPKPPRVSIPLGHPARDVLPSATGTPALARRDDGRANLGTEANTKQAGDSRAQTSSAKRTRAAVSSFNDASV